jgi:hypothetical protein
MKIRPAGAEEFHADGQTNRYDEDKVSYCNFTSAPKKFYFIYAPKNKHPHFKSVPQKFIFSHIGPTGIASLKTNALYHVCDTFIAFCSITTALTCHGQLRQAP